jgi:rod shape determining protein RodA
MFQGLILILKNRKSLFTALGIIGIPAAVVLAIPDVGSMLGFIAFLLLCISEGLSGTIWVGFIFAGVFLVALAIPPVM